MGNTNIHHSNESVISNPYKGKSLELSPEALELIKGIQTDTNLDVESLVEDGLNVESQVLDLADKQNNAPVELSAEAQKLLGELGSLDTGIQDDTIPTTKIIH